MSLQAKDEFLEWVDAVEAERGWTDNAWTSKAKLSASVLNKARRQGIIPGWDACKALAEAANKSPIVAFRKAGLLPPGPENEIVIEDWQYLLSKMNPQEREDLKAIGVMWIERREKDKSLKSLKTRKAG